MLGRAYGTLLDMTARAWLTLALILVLACDPDSNDARPGAESSDAQDADIPADDASTDPDDANVPSRSDGGARDMDASGSSDASMDGATVREGGTSDGATADGSQRFMPPSNMPWAGQCEPGLNGTVQMRKDCSVQEIAAIQAAGVGPAKAFNFAIYSYALNTAMQAGKPFTFSITAFGGQPLHMEFWGASSACGATNLEKLAAMLTPGGIICATMTPSAAHTHLLLVVRVNGNGYYTQVHSECPDGACVMNTGTAAEWPDKDKLFCDPQALNECEVCSADDACGAPVYMDRGDGTVSSSCCGLTWQKAADAPVMTWAEAGPYCSGLTTAGGGFRLPTFAELNSLVKAGSAPTIDTNAFPATRSLLFWSASESNDFRSEAWTVNFNSGFPYSAKKVDKQAVRCVR
jgi:hypothetical protein